MESNSDRMGFALLVIVFISFLLIGVNSTTDVTKNFFKDFSSWLSGSRNEDINKDKYKTYYAYSWSSNGQDRFTTKDLSSYNVLNLVTPTPTYSMVGNNTTNQTSIVASLADQTKSLADLGFKTNDKLTVSADINVSVSDAKSPGGSFRIQLGAAPWGIGFNTTQINGKSQTYHQSVSFNVDSSLSATVKGVGLRLDNVPKSTTVSVVNVRFQNSNGETISPYVGKYSGLSSAKQSTNYKDYDWMYNANYIIKNPEN